MVARRYLLPAILFAIGLCACSRTASAEPTAVYPGKVSTPPPSRWISPDGQPKPSHKRPVYGDSIVITGFMALGARAEAGANGRIAIIVHNSIYDTVLPSVTELTWDLSAAGWSTIVSRYTSGPPDSVREYLSNLYHSPDGLKGAILIGDIPYIIYEMMQTWDGGAHYDYDDFPCDIYYMDLDGVWSDSLTDRQVQPNNGKYDTRGGNLGLEIWVGRIKTSNLSSAGNQSDLVANYVAKARQFRSTPLRTARYAIAYNDDDWSYMAGEDKAKLESVFGAGYCAAISDPEATTALDYKTNTLLQSTRWHLVRSHGYASGHAFYRASRTILDNVYPEDYLTIDPPGSFFCLYVCGGCDYTASNYLGGTITFNPASDAVLTIGTSKTGGMWAESYFYSLMGQGKCVGEAFRLWFNQVQTAYPHYTPSWWYGMTLIGDPSLHPNPSTYPTYHHLTVSVAPGSVGAVSPSAGDHIYPDGQLVPINATPAVGHRFDHWEGPVADPYSPSTTVTLTSNTTVTAHMPPVTISDAKRLADGASVQLKGKVITYADPDWFYIQEDNRTCGVRVEKAGHRLLVGSRADVTGVMRTDSNHERYISATSTANAGTGSIRPICLPVKWIGGSDWFHEASTGAGQRRVHEGFGLNNVGMLLRTIGSVEPIDSRGFYISNCNDRVKVLVPPGMTVPCGGPVAVTGVVACELSGGLVRPVLRLRSLADLTAF